MARPIAVDPRFKSDVIMHQINRIFISLDDEETRKYNVHLKTVLDLFIQLMEHVDSTFSACYQRIAYVGSSYEGLKIGEPEEFDLNIVIKLPIDYHCLTHEVAVENSGYVKIKADADVLPKLMKHERWSEYKVMKSWFDENSYLNQNKFRNWFESVATKAHAMIPSHYVPYSTKPDRSPKYYVSHKKSGPALTLIIDVPGGHIVHVDLVPVLEFTTQPPKPFIDRNTTWQKWFTIAKPIEGSNNHILWRPSFYEREREILKGSIKPAIRLMKKLRDTQNFGEIASYYIKTLFLREFEIREQEFQNWPLTFLFFHMLKKLQEACENHKILDFWNRRNNLLSKIGKQRMIIISCRLTKIISAIDRRITDDPYVIAEFILTEAELDQLKQSPITSEMASMSLTPNAEVLVPESEQNNGYLAGMWNSFLE